MSKAFFIGKLLSGLADKSIAREQEGYNRDQEAKKARLEAYNKILTAGDITPEQAKVYTNLMLEEVEGIKGLDKNQKTQARSVIEGIQGSQGPVTLGGTTIDDDIPAPPQPVDYNEGRGPVLGALRRGVGAIGRSIGIGGPAPTTLRTPPIVDPADAQRATEASTRPQSTQQAIPPVPVAQTADTAPAAASVGQVAGPLAPVPQPAQAQGASFPAQSASLPPVPAEPTFTSLRGKRTYDDAVAQARAQIDTRKAALMAEKELIPVANDIEREKVAGVLETYKQLSGKDPDDAVLNAAMGLNVGTRAAAKFGTKPIAGEALLNTDLPTLDGSPIDPKWDYLPIMDGDGNITTLMPVRPDVDADTAIKQINDVYGGKVSFVQVGPKGMSQLGEVKTTPRKQPQADAGDGITSLQKANQISRGLLGIKDLPQKERPAIAQAAIDNNIPLLSTKQREDVAALDKADVLMSQVFKSVVQELGYADVDTFMQSVEVDESGNPVDSPLGGPLQRLAGGGKQIAGAIGMNAAARELDSVRADLGPLLARGWGNRGNLAIPEQENAKKAVPTLTDTEAEVFRKLNRWRRSRDGIKQALAGEANTDTRAWLGGGAGIPAVPSQANQSAKPSKDALIDDILNGKF